MDRTENEGMSSGEVEVTSKPVRRRFKAAYKLRILRAADACKASGEVGALLRREGLYSSSLSEWRKQRDRGELEGLTEKRRGPVPNEKNPLADKVWVLERENARLRRRAERAEGLVALQKKVSEVLGIELRREGETD